ncbi:MAG: PIN domain-containing protein [Candidatus Odinarchaeota archaeon]
MRVYLDANFFISGFSDRPKDVAIIKAAADKIDAELWITRQVFQELRWYLRREVETIIQIDETLSKDIKAFTESIKRPESSLPQANDMSLILAAMRSKKSKIVTSDMKLLSTIQELKVDVEGIVGSAFVLELMELADDEDMKKSLAPIRDRIYSEEVRYSIARQESYDPVTRIRIIEDHALRVLRAVKRPAEGLDRQLAKGQPLFVLDFLEDIKADIPNMFDDFRDGKYDTLALEIETVQNEIERLLIVSTLTEDTETHGKLVRHAADLTLFLYYLEMICHLYRGTREGMEDALAMSEEAFRLLMFAEVQNDELKASVFFVRILLSLIREDYNQIDYFYSLYDSMINRLSLDTMMETTEGFYITMQVLRSEVMGGFSLTKTKLQFPDVTIAMLNDIAKYSLLFDDHDNAWQLAVTAYKIGVAYNREEGALSSFRMLYKVSSSSHDRFKPALEKISEHALKAFVKKGWNTNLVTPILNEVQGEFPRIENMSTGGPAPFKSLPDELKGWMDVLTLENIEGEEVLVVRNEVLQARIAIMTKHHPILSTLKTGHKVALTKGKFEVTNTKTDVVKSYSIILTVIPSELSEISYEGEYGFSCLKVAVPETEA